MPRYLLFDSGCSTCAELAQAVEQATHGGLEARSLRDPAMQRLLAQARPHWRWQPTLLEVEGERVRAFTGLALGLHLMMKLGPRRTLRLVRLTGHFGVSLKSKGSVDLGRRRFLEQLAAVALVLGWPRFLGSSRNKSGMYSQGYEGEIYVGNQSHTRSLGSEPPPGVEEYAGFLLLPEGTPVPSFVRYPERGIPVFCGVGDAEITAVSQSLTGAEDLVKQLGFPIYTFRELPNGLRPIGANLIRYKTGEVYAASVNFGSFDQSNNSRGMVSITAQPDFPRPFPLRSSASVEPGGPAVILQKVSFLPSPGIMVATYKGYIFFWIEEDILYTLLAEHSPSREEVQALAGSLVLLE